MWDGSGFGGFVCRDVPGSCFVGLDVFAPIPVLCSVTVTGFLLGGLVAASSSTAISAASVFCRSVLGRTYLN